MSRRTRQFARVAASGPLIEVSRNNPAACSVIIRAAKTKEAFASTMPRNMRPEKQQRIMARLYPKRGD